jgi:hypothetical protein
MENPEKLARRSKIKHGQSRETGKTKENKQKHNTIYEQTQIR